MWEKEKPLLTLLNLSDSKLGAEAMLMFRGITPQLEPKNGRQAVLSLTKVYLRRRVSRNLQSYLKKWAEFSKQRSLERPLHSILIT